MIAASPYTIITDIESDPFWYYIMDCKTFEYIADESGRAWHTDDEAVATTKLISLTAHPFRSLAGMVYTDCPCGCGAKAICNAQIARVKAHNDALPF